MLVITILTISTICFSLGIWNSSDSVVFFFNLKLFQCTRVLLWKLHVKVVLSDNPIPLKVPDLYSSDVRSAHSFSKSSCALHPPFYFFTIALEFDRALV